MVGFPCAFIHFQFWCRADGHVEITLMSAYACNYLIPYIILDLCLCLCWPCLGCLSIQQNPPYALGNAVLYAHAWSIHSSFLLNKEMLLKKQKLFWLYMFQPLVATSFWWSLIQEATKDQKLVSVLPLFVGPTFQYGGQWALYKYIRGELLY
jgi:hypothetical protein